MSQNVGAVHIKVNDASVWNRFKSIDEYTLATLGIAWQHVGEKKDLSYYDHADYICFGCLGVKNVAQKVADVLDGDGMFIMVSTDINVDPFIEYAYYFGQNVKYGTEFYERLQYNLPEDVFDWIVTKGLRLSDDNLRFLGQYDERFIQRLLTREADRKAKVGKNAKSMEETPIEGGKLVITGVKEVEAKKYRNRQDIVSVEIMGDVQSIGQSAFLGCKAIKTVVFHDGLLKIKKSAFSKCSGIEEIIIPSSVEKIGDHAFWGCAGLKKIKIEDGCSNSKKSVIEDSAFQECKNLKEVEIGNCVGQIGRYAFFKSASIESVYIGSGVELVESFAFADCKKIKDVNISDIKSWCKMEFGVEESNPTYYAKNLSINGKNVVEIDIPAEIKTIKEYTFINCKRIKKINIEDGLTDIEYQAFFGCSSLESITIPNSVLNISEYAFEECKKVVIYGEKNSYSEKYADTNGIKFREK